MTCITLAALIANPYLPFADEIRNRIKGDEELIIEQVDRDNVFQVKQVINMIPGVVVTRLICDDGGCTIAVSRIH